MIILHAVGVIKPEKRQRWFALLDAVTPPLRAEDACQSYVLYEAAETPNTFIFVEEWASLDGLYAYFHTPHFTEFFAGLGEVLAEPPAEDGLRGVLNEIARRSSCGCRNRRIRARAGDVLASL
jgi:quinol monooxygenase YgiN